MVMNYKNLLVIRVVIDLNLKKFGVEWFDRVFSIELWKVVASTIQ